MAVFQNLFNQARAFGQLYRTTGVDIGPFKKVHAGSWLGLPDIGTTEFVQSVFASDRPLTPQGGSNLFGTAPAKEPPPQRPPEDSRQTNGQAAGDSGAPIPAPAPQQPGGGETGPSMRDINPKRSLSPL